MSGGVVAGIVLGAVFGLVTVALLCVLLSRRWLRLKGSRAELASVASVGSSDSEQWEGSHSSQPVQLELHCL